MTATARSGVVDGKREDSSDQTSGVLSLENLRENENEGVDWGDASNTTPAKSASPRIAEAVAETGPDAKMVDAPPADESGMERDLSAGVVLCSAFQDEYFHWPTERARLHQAPLSLCSQPLPLAFCLGTLI